MRRILLSIAIAMFAWGSATAKTTVKVEQGLLDGTVDQGLTIYRGIPFAAPPVGDLRWRAPQPAAKWDGVRHAGQVRAGVRAERILRLREQRRPR